MNRDIDTGGPAFPTESEHQSGGEQWHFEGMTLRDYFAAKAMQGFAVDLNADWADGIDGMARGSYAWADAMLAARATK